MKLIVGEALKIAAAGLALGVIASLLLTSAMVKLLFEVNASDPATFVAVSILILVVVFIASYFPARKAAKLAPLAALRHE